MSGVKVALHVSNSVSKKPEYTVWNGPVPDKYANLFIISG